jgi:hypothetical protein
MLTRFVVTAALLTYAIAVACALAPADTSAADRSPESLATDTPVTPAPLASPTKLATLPFCGAGMQIQRVDWIDEYKKSIDQLAAIGADSVLFVIDTRMENGTSSKIYLDMRMTPTPDQLGALIDHAKSKNLRVILMPIVLLDNPRGNEWRGTLKPESWDDWWASYREMMNHFAWIAEGHHADVLVIGSELVTTESKLDEWTRTIRAVRQTFKGRLTYSANWDHYVAIPFWDQLDLISTNCYYELGKDKNVTIPEIKKRWAEIQKDLLGFTRKKGKPLFFTEVGWCSMANAADAPWDYTQDAVPQDDELQRKLYEAFFESWWGNPASGGFMIWEWSPGEGGKGDKDQQRGYTPENKPAEEVLKQWLAKPRWQVKVK